MALTRRAVILGLAGAGFLAGRAPAEGFQTEGGLAFGSTWRITTDDTVILAALRPKLEAVLRQIDTQMSPYRATSQLSVFNASRMNDRQEMPQELCYVAANALRIAKLTDGAFDPTVGPVVSRFGFGPITGRPGAYSQIGAAPNTLRKSEPGLTLDLCGIAKGYALDRIGETLTNSGVRSAMIEVGGEAKMLGRHPSGRRWRVAISDPTVSTFRAYCLVAPGENAVATSGHAVNGLKGPVRISHIINPKLKRPADTDLASVSVLASTGMEADALATALCAVGRKKGVALARELGVSALFIVRDGTDTSDIMTGHFADHLLI